jgi:hypothetical protein
VSPAGGFGGSFRGQSGGGGGGGGGGAPAKAAAASVDALPEGWTMQRDDEGDTYYFHTVTGESRWERPLPPKKSAAPVLTAGGHVFQGIKATGPAVKSTLVSTPTDAPKVEIETVVIAGEDAACTSFDANPFKPEMCKRCRKLKNKH